MQLLYPISAKLEGLQEALEIAGGEVTPEQANEYFKTSENFQAACLDMARLIKGLEDDEANIIAEQRRLTDRKQALKARVASLRRFTAEHMLARDQKSIKDALYSLSARLGKQALVIDDPTLLHVKFFKEPPPPPDPEIDRKALQEALEAGEVHPGAHLEPGSPILTIR